MVMWIQISQTSPHPFTSLHNIPNLCVSQSVNCTMCWLIMKTLSQLVDNDLLFSCLYNCFSCFDLYLLMPVPSCICPNAQPHKNIFPFTLGLLLRTAPPQGRAGLLGPFLLLCLESLGLSLFTLVIFCLFYFSEAILRKGVQCANFWASARVACFNLAPPSPDRVYQRFHRSPVPLPSTHPVSPSWSQSPCFTGPASSSQPLPPLLPPLRAPLLWNLALKCLGVLSIYFDEN